MTMNAARLGASITAGIDAIPPGLTLVQEAAVLANMTALAAATIDEIEEHYSGGGDSSDHADLDNLPWTSSGHTGTASRVAGFSGAGAAAYYVIGTDLQAYSATLAAVAAGTYTGDDSITTLGTIATGVWQGSVIGPTYLGTGSGITTKFLRGDGTWQTVSGSGDVVGPASATDHAVARFDLTTGKLLQDSVLIVSDLGVLTGGEWQGTAVADGYIASAATWNAKEPAIGAGTTAQYWRGDKSWQTLDKTAVGLANVENAAASGLYVPLGRTVGTTAPLTGGGALSGNLTLAVSAATTAAAGVVELATDGEAIADRAVQGNDSRLSNARTPIAHEASHVSGGSDPFLSTDVLEAVVRRLQTTTGPTILLLGAVGDGQYLKRSGTALVGDAPTAQVAVGAASVVFTGDGEWSQRATVTDAAVTSTSKIVLGVAAAASTEEAADPGWAYAVRVVRRQAGTFDIKVTALNEWGEYSGDPSSPNETVTVWYILG